jgi:hypothetical protein
MASGALLAPEQILSLPIPDHRLDLVEEFRAAPLGPFSDELRQLLWLLRAQTPHGRYALRRLEDERWQVIRLLGRRRPTRKTVAVLETREDAEWAIFACRWNDQTGGALSLRREAR